MAKIIFTEEEWANSQLSVARHFGGLTINGEEYLIVNEKGITLFQLSDPTSRHYVNTGKAIEAGKPADLVCKRYIPKYKKMGREAFIAAVKNGSIA